MRRARDPLTPVEREVRRRRIRRWTVAVVVVAVFVGLAVVLGRRFALNRPVAYEGLGEEFKYGSIGSAIENGLPLRVLHALRPSPATATGAAAGPNTASS
jgi:hypothetical protein